MYKSLYGKGVNACISLILESVLIFSEAKGLTLYTRITTIDVMTRFGAFTEFEN